MKAPSGVISEHLLMARDRSHAVIQALELSAPRSRFLKAYQVDEWA
jgi:hypothetical protein